MSDTEAAVAIEELDVAPSTLEEESVHVEMARKSKAKKKGKSPKKRGEAVEEEDGDGEDGNLSRGKKKKGKKRARGISDIYNIQPVVGEGKRLDGESVAGEASLLDGTPKDTIIEIKDEKQADELDEIVVKKEQALAGGNSLVEEEGRKPSTEENEDTKERDGQEETKERPGGVRRRATLTDLKADSIDKGDGEQPGTLEAAAEVRSALILTFTYINMHVG